MADPGAQPLEKSRFVAALTGRTNLLDGRRDGDRIVVPGLPVPIEGIAGGAASFSVRPQNIVLRRDGPFPGTWRAAGSEILLRFNAPPDDMHTVGKDVLMEIGPARIAPVPGPEGDAR